MNRLREILEQAESKGVPVVVDSLRQVVASRLELFNTDKLSRSATQ